MIPPCLLKKKTHEKKVQAISMSPSPHTLPLVVDQQFFVEDQK